MEITYEVETGDASSTSTTYASIDDLKQYFYNNNYSYDALNDTDIKRLVNKATLYIDSNYTFPGNRQTETQKLAWPRESAYYLPEYYDIAESYIPPEVISAVCETANLLNQGTDPMETISKDGRISAYSNSVDVIKESVKYESGSTLYSDIYVLVDSILYRLTGGVSNSYALTVMRTAGDSP